MKYVSALYAPRIIMKGLCSCHLSGEGVDKVGISIALRDVGVVVF